jgi:hypothetical protein
MPGEPMAINNLGGRAGTDGQIWFPSDNSIFLDPWCPVGTFAHMDLYRINQAVSAVGVTVCEVGDGVFEGYGFKATHSNTAPWTYEDLTAAVGDPHWFIDFPTGIGEYGHIIA